MPCHRLKAASLGEHVCPYMIQNINTLIPSHLPPHERRWQRYMDIGSSVFLRFIQGNSDRVVYCTMIAAVQMRCLKEFVPVMNDQLGRSWIWTAQAVAEIFRDDVIRCWDKRPDLSRACDDISELHQ